MSHVPPELRYTPTHEWVSKNSDGTLTVGITEHAQKLLGDMVYVELPAIGSQLTIKGEAGVVESVKAASDVYSPVSGKVIENNADVVANPALVNTDPYGEGWLFKLEPLDSAEVENLLDAAAYTVRVAADEH